MNRVFNRVASTSEDTLRKPAHSLGKCLRECRLPEIEVKNDRHGKAKILTQSAMQLLFSQGFQEDRDSEALLRSADHALFGICLFSACRIREACTLRVTDAYDASGRILPKLKIRKANTKGKLATRSIPIISDLRVLLTNYHPSVGQPYLFPGRFG